MFVIPLSPQKATHDLSPEFHIHVFLCEIDATYFRQYEKFI